MGATEGPDALSSLTATQMGVSKARTKNKEIDKKEKGRRQITKNEKWTRVR